MIKCTFAEAQAYFAERHMKLVRNPRDGWYRVEFSGSTFSPREYKTLDGAVKSFRGAAEFEQWLIAYRGLKAARND